MSAPAVSEREPGNRVQILSSVELCRTLDRLASQILESVVDPAALVLLGIPTRGVALAQVLADRLALMVGHAVAHGSLDPTFYRDDLEQIGSGGDAITGNVLRKVTMSIDVSL